MPIAACCCSTGSSWSHFGDTWALPGGARHEGESAADGALREAAEEAGVPDGAIRPRLLSVLDLGYWSYTTLVGDVTRPFEPTISDPESRELAWIPPDEVADKPLHPGFASSWEHAASRCWACGPRSSSTPRTWWAPSRTAGGTIGPERPGG